MRNNGNATMSLENQSSSDPYALRITHYASRWATWVSLALLAIALVLPLTRFVTTSSAWLDYPYPRPGSEGLILYESLLVKRGGDIYAPITPERFISGPYPPVYYLLAAWALPGTSPAL